MVAHDDFDDGSFDASWLLDSVNTDGGTDGWTIEESGSHLRISNVDPATVHDSGGMEWSQLSLTQDIGALSNLLEEVDVDWEAADAAAMQYLYIYLHADGGASRIAFAGYVDAWISANGQQAVDIGGYGFSSGFDSLPNNGAAAIKLLRQAGNLQIIRNGEPIHEGSAAGDLDRVRLVFGHYPLDDGSGAVSGFGGISVDRRKISAWAI